MANVLDENKKDQVLVLGGLGWSLRRIEQETSVRRETASAYLKSRWRGGAWPRAAEAGFKTGHFQGLVHRPGAFKPGHHGGGVHRP